MSDDGNNKPFQCSNFWSDGDYDCNMEGTMLDIQNQKTLKILSVHLSVNGGSETFPGYVFECRLHLGPETNLNNDDQAYIIHPDLRDWRRARLGAIQGKWLRKAIFQRPTAVFLRCVQGNLILSVSKTCSMHRDYTNG
jgi:hypothetical protein